MSQSSAKTKLLEAALYVIRAQGYTATTVEDICKHAGVTKGSFFHHFKSKEELALEVAKFFSEMAEGFFASAPYQKKSDPLERILGYVDFRIENLKGELPEYTCLLGTMVQEVYTLHPEIRKICDDGMTAHIEELVKDLKAAKKLYAPKAKWTAESVGYFIQVVLQGSFIFAKAKQNPAVIKSSLEHLKIYLNSIFNKN